MAHPPEFVESIKAADAVAFMPSESCLLFYLGRTIGLSLAAGVVVELFLRPRRVLRHRPWQPFLTVCGL